jgi:3-oxoacyl-(acyl-carrier-protein) synthase
VTARRVVVRGVGAWSPLATTWPATAEALAAGASAVAPVTAWDASEFPCRVAAACTVDSGEGEDRRRPLARAAAREAWQAAGVSRGRIGVFIGAESGRASFRTVLELGRAAGAGGRFDAAAFAVRARAFAARIDASVISPAAIAADLAREVNATGPVLTVSLACASGAAAIDVALAGGVGADAEPLMLAGFGLLGALSARGESCPFDQRRDGFVVGEGAAMLVLTAADVAGAPPSCEIAGVGRSLDGYRLTAPEPDGDGAARAIATAMADAREEVVEHVQAHGTSTPLNDPAEIVALRRALGAAFECAQVSSVKGAVGHWVAGAGAIGALCAIDAIVHQRVLPTAGLRAPDAPCAARHVMGRAVACDVRAALVNAFAFGGANASLVLRRWEGA